jgi:hypothetical protein
MTLTHAMGPPHFMITTTANPNWPEIQENKIYGQAGIDIISRVFHMRLANSANAIRSGAVFGPVLYELTVVEFQKRGLPHAHSVVAVEQSPEAQGRIDTYICAEFPNRHDNPELFAKVKKFMIHNPCVGHDPHAKCLRSRNGVVYCSKGFPRPLSETTTINSLTGRMTYRCRPLPREEVASDASSFPFHRLFLSTHEPPPFPLLFFPPGPSGCSIPGSAWIRPPGGVPRSP